MPRLNELLWPSFPLRQSYKFLVFIIIFVSLVAVALGEIAIIINFLSANKFYAKIKEEEIHIVEIVKIMKIVKIDENAVKEKNTLHLLNVL